MIKERRYADRVRFREWLRSLKDNKECVDCEQQYPWYVLQWDHLPEYQKEYTIGDFSRNVVSKEKVLNEIAKCELVCANCHSIRTYERQLSVVGDTLLS